MAATQGGAGAQRGGWGTTLITDNLMDDAMPQPSLSQGLMLGVGKAHRQQVHGGPEFRNYRRSSPFDQHGHRHVGLQDFSGEDDGYESQRTTSGRSFLTVEEELRQRRNGR